MQVADLLL